MRGNESLGIVAPSYPKPGRRTFPRVLGYNRRRTWVMSEGQPAPLRVLVADDEKNIRATLGMCLESLGCDVTPVATAAAALATAAAQPLELAFVDLRLGADDGLGLVPQLLAKRPEL